MSNPYSRKTLNRAQLEDACRGNAPSAFRRARRILGGDADAKEVVHDLFVSLIERPAQFAGTSSLSTILDSAVTHACIKRIRGRTNRRRLLRGFGINLLFNSSRSMPPDSLSIPLAALRHLPEPRAEVAAYYYMDGLIHADIARTLGCSRRQVGNRIAQLKRWAARQEAPPCPV